MADMTLSRHPKHVVYITLRDEVQGILLWLAAGAVRVMRLKTDGRTWVPNGVSGGDASSVMGMPV